MKLNNFLLIIFIGINCVTHAQEKGTFEDSRDGRVYKTIQIGNQTWMSENLSFKADTGCWAYNNDENHIAKYGRLYTYEMALNVCPQDWHLPSKEEIEALVRYAGTTGKHAYNELIPTGFSGFNGVFGGFYNKKGFQYIGKIGHFWSSTEINAGSAWYLGITSMVNDAGLCFLDRVKNSNNKSWGFSVRCIKNMEEK